MAAPGVTVACMPAPAAGRRFRGRWRAGVAVILATLLAGCTARFVYNQLDWLTVWYLNGFFSLDKAQEEQLREIVDRNLEWHRTTQLPRYAALCRQLDAELGEGLGADYFEARFDDMQLLWVDFMTQIAPDAAVFLRTLDAEQRAELRENFAESNRELADEYSGRSPEVRQRKRDRAVIKNLQRLTGRLNAEQKDLVRAHTARFHDLTEDWLVRRQRWQEVFLGLLDEAPQAREFEARLVTLLAMPDYLDEPDYRRRVEENKRISFEMLADLTASLSDKQLAEFRRRLGNYARDFEILAAQRQM